MYYLPSFSKGRWKPAHCSALGVGPGVGAGPSSSLLKPQDTAGPSLSFAFLASVLRGLCVSVCVWGGGKIPLSGLEGLCVPFLSHPFSHYRSLMVSLSYSLL